MRLTPIQEAVVQYHRAGRSVIPIKANTKKPAIPWKVNQDRLPTTKEVVESFGGDDKNVGIVCGDVSGGLAALDIDNPLLAYRMVGDDHLRAATTLVRTRSSGLHVYMIETDATSRGGPLVPGVADLQAARHAVANRCVAGLERLRSTTRRMTHAHYR